MKVRIVVVLLLVMSVSAFGMESFSLLRVSTPLVVSGAAGLRTGHADGTMRPTIQGELGVGGGRILVGLDQTGQGRFGHAIKGSILRTWLEPLSVDAGQTFLGLEGEVSLGQLLLNAGGYRRVSEGNDGWLLSAGIGFIF